MSLTRTLLLSLAVIGLLDLSLRLSGRRVLVQSKGGDGWAVEGDLLYPEWSPALNKFPDKKRVPFTTCTYWNGLSLTKVSLPVADLRDGCPNGLLKPKS